MRIRIFIYLSLFTFHCSLFTLSAQNWEPVGSGLSGEDSLTAHVNTLCVYHNKLYAGGDFTYAGKKKVNHLACWDGKKWYTVGNGINGEVLALSTYKNYLCVMGDFYNTVRGMKQATSIVLWNDTTGWRVIGSGYFNREKPLPEISAACVYHARLYFGGTFHYVDNVAANGIAVWDGQKVSTVGSHAANFRDFKNGAGIEGVVSSMIGFNNSLFTGGNFANADGVNVVDIAQWNDTLWKPVGNVPYKPTNDINVIARYGNINSLVAFQNQLYAGGSFNTLGGMAFNGIAKWEGTKWLDVGKGVYGTIEAMAVYDGKLYVSGHIDSAGGKPVKCIAMWNGNTWDKVGDGFEMRGLQAHVKALAVYHNELYAAGWFHYSGKKHLMNIARLNLDNKETKKGGVHKAR